MLTDELWSKLRTMMHQQGIYDKPNLRMMVEGMLYRSMRVGCPWSDLRQYLVIGIPYTKNLIAGLQKIS